MERMTEAMRSLKGLKYSEDEEDCDGNERS